jgi:hypothetical protein
MYLVSGSFLSLSVSWPPWGEQLSSTMPSSPWCPTSLPAQKQWTPMDWHLWNCEPKETIPLWSCWSQELCHSNNKLTNIHLDWIINRKNRGFGIFAKSTFEFCVTLCLLISISLNFSRRRKKERKLTHFMWLPREVSEIMQVKSFSWIAVRK